MTSQEEWLDTGVERGALRDVLERSLNGVAYCRMSYEDGKPVDFVYLYTNPAFHRQTGLGPVAGRRVSDVMPGIRQTDARLFKVYGRVADGGGPERCEVYVEALHQWFAIEAFSPKPGHFVAIFDVITERKRLADELRRHRGHLEQLVLERTEQLALAKAAAEAECAAKSALIKDASHEVRTRLGAILALTHQLRTSGATSDHDDKLRSIEEIGRHVLSFLAAAPRREAAKLEAGHDRRASRTLSESARSMARERAFAGSGERRERHRRR